MINAVNEKALPGEDKEVPMSSELTPIPEPVFKIAKATVYTELTPPTEVASAKSRQSHREFRPTTDHAAKRSCQKEAAPRTPLRHLH